MHISHRHHPHHYYHHTAPTTTTQPDRVPLDASLLAGEASINGMFGDFCVGGNVCAVTWRDVDTLRGALAAYGYSTVGVVRARFGLTPHAELERVL